jgi:uncharacterized protein DUF6815
VDPVELGEVDRRRLQVARRVRCIRHAGREGRGGRPLGREDRGHARTTTRIGRVAGLVNPIELGLDRSKLDPLLREVGEAGVSVSAHPDVILKMATKRVLFDTRLMSWGTETAFTAVLRSSASNLPARLAARGPLVLKQHRGMGGNGVWKVELEDPNAAPDQQAPVLVQPAAKEGGPERLLLDEFVRRCEPYFGRTEMVVEQPFQPRLSDGMIRAYLTNDEVVGFTHQYPRGLRPPGADNRPTAKVFEPAAASSYRDLRASLESEWVPQLQEILGLEAHSLPVISDADFLYGPETSSGGDTYILREINVSSTFAFPESAMPIVARAGISGILEHGL